MFCKKSKILRYIICSTFLFLSFLNTGFSQSGWFQQNSGTTLPINEVQFLDGNTGYIVCGTYSIGAGQIRKTTNGGQTWFLQLSLSYRLAAVYFIDVNTGDAVGVDPIAKRTTNGGTTWFNQNITEYNVSGVHFVDANTGVIVGAIGIGQNGIILFTTDGGSSWINRNYGHDARWFDVHFFDANTGIVVGDYFGFGIIRTTNSGINWTVVTPYNPMRSVSFADNNKGIACGRNVIYRTTNNGINWTAQTLNTMVLNSVSYVDTNIAYVVGDTGKILYTTNAGVNWLQQNSGTTQHLYSVNFINQNTGWATGNNGIILKTTTGGVTGITIVSSQIPIEFKLYQNYPNPFNPNTKVKFQISKEDFVKLVVYDILGNKIAVLVNEKLKAGTYEVEFDGMNYPSGVYYYKLEADYYIETRKLVLLK